MGEPSATWMDFWQRNVSWMRVAEVSVMGMNIVKASRSVATGLNASTNPAANFQAHLREDLASFSFSVKRLRCFSGSP